MYGKSTQFFYDKVVSDFQLIEQKELDKVYEANSHYFDTLSLKSFVGYIPKDVTEPVLKVFEDYGESIERWTLWQSWYINRKAMNDPLKLDFYHGMMMYIKVLNTMSRIHKKPYLQSKPITNDTKVETPWIDTVLEDINTFKESIKKNETQTN